MERSVFGRVSDIDVAPEAPIMVRLDPEVLDSERFQQSLYLARIKSWAHRRWGS